MVVNASIEKTNAMKLILSLLLMMSLNASIAQNETNQGYFAQCMMDIQDQSVMAEIEEAIRNNPKVKIVRLSYEMQYAFLMTNDVESLSETEFRSWFGVHGSALTCVQIGVNGVDERHSFPFTNCQN